jgi:hypothetical protein
MGRMRGRTVQRIVVCRGQNRSKDGENEGKREEGEEQCGGCMGDWLNGGERYTYSYSRYKEWGIEREEKKTMKKIRR